MRPATAISRRPQSWPEVDVPTRGVDKAHQDDERGDDDENGHEQQGQRIEREPPAEVAELETPRTDDEEPGREKR